MVCTSATLLLDEHHRVKGGVLQHPLHIVVPADLVVRGIVGVSEAPHCVAGIYSYHADKDVFLTRKANMQHLKTRFWALIVSSEIGVGS